ncbi:hypothetical protein Ancab_013345 [Ancistrocladus abbreviatus]
MRKPSYADMVCCRTHSPDQQLEADRGKSRNLINNFNMEIKTCKLEYEWLKGCYTEVVKSRMSITKLGARLIKASISNYVIRPIGGNLVLLSVKGDTRMEKIMVDNRGKLVGINEGLQKSSEMEWVSDTNGINPETVYKVGGGVATACRPSDGRFDNYTGDDIQGSIEPGLDLDKIKEGNRGVSLSVKGH